MPGIHLLIRSDVAPATSLYLEVEVVLDRVRLVGIFVEVVGVEMKMWKVGGLFELVKHMSMIVILMQESHLDLGSVLS